MISEVAPLDGYTWPADSPRPEGGLVKERIDPVVAAARGGDPDAVQALLLLIKPTVVRYCRARIGGRDLSYLSADDVAQEVCLAVLKVLPNYQDRGGSFLYLVRAIAANKVADAFRSVARDRSKPVPELPDRPLSGNEPENHVLELDLGARLGRLLAVLPPLHQEILSLRIVAGLSANETAEALGISAGNVRITQFRALTKLRGMIGERGL
ncbi:RNA polymerase sigma factor ShbA [Amycolatopsis sp. CA-128772]|uniref:RNA polymerase sigma factor ShbA n=1 Tax=Amycolatopsis sp. CA-128772 TaxID=2073159 RepID=UPI001E5601A7|nr:RNA polymerase sigma factor ShbA [Amycolatopsis sp. CA-128772]